MLIRDLFRQAAELSPRRTAVVDAEHSVTYAELQDSVRRLATFLSGEGASAETTIGVVCDRSAETAALILGVLEAGAALVPIDPSHPRARIDDILQEAQPLLLATTTRTSVVADAWLTDRTFSFQDAVERVDSPTPPPACHSNSLAYVLFIGAAGHPRGVMVEQDAISGLVQVLPERLGAQPSDVWGVLHSFSLDVGLWEILAPLTTGGTAVILPQEDRSIPGGQLVELLAASGVTILSHTPSAFGALCRDIPAADLARSGVRMVLLGEEPVDGNCLERWRRAAAPCRVINLYGMTEAVVHSTIQEHQLRLVAPDAVNVGQPRPNVVVRILDTSGQPVKAGTTGEICIGGPALARGYLRSPGLTADRFIPDPLAGEPGARLYRSGDRGRIDWNGNIELVGRFDRQFKLGEFRVEPAEVEAAIKRDARVVDVSVVRQEGSDGPRLEATVVVNGEGVTKEGILVELRQQLPVWSLPSEVLVVDHESDPASVSSSGSTDLERTLLGIWSRVLETDGIKPDDDFFAVGGHSLAAMRVVAQVRAVCGVDLDVRKIFDAPTVIELARHVEREMSSIEEP